MVPRPTIKAPKQRKTRAEISEIRRAAGRNGGLRKAGRVSIATLQKDLVRAHIDQRLMRSTDVYINSHISLARGQQFLYRIKKTWVQTGKDETSGYWRNEKPELVTAQYEIEAYLEELADNNGNLSDDKDSGDTYYFITTKEPNIIAVNSGLDRVHGRPKETQDINVNNTFSLLGLHKQREIIDGNKDVEIIPELPDAV